MCVPSRKKRKLKKEMNKKKHHHIHSGGKKNIYRRFDGVSGPVALLVAGGDFQLPLRVVVGVRFPKRQSGNVGRNLGKV